MDKTYFENLPEENYNEKEWQKAIDYFWDRYNKRYFHQLKALIEHTDSEIRFNCGFIITSIDCILIETLEQFYSGEDETKSKSIDEVYFTFFSRSNKLTGIFADKKDAGKFAGLIRSGLIHQSKTKKSSIINIKKTTPIVDWIDTNEKHKGFQINRNLFHDCVKIEFNNYIEKLKEKKNTDLRINFKKKILSLIN